MRVHAFTVVVYLLAGAAAASGQDKLQGGVIGGPSSATLSVSGEGTVPDFNARAGFSAGLFVVREIRPGVAFEPEALVTLKGGNATEGSLDVAASLTALEFPLLARFHPTSAGKASFHVVGGPVVSFRLTAEQKFTTPAGTTTVDVKDETRAAEFGLAAGAGVNVGRFRFDGRYTWGLSRLDDDDTDGLDVKSGVFTVLVGVRLW